MEFEELDFKEHVLYLEQAEYLQGLGSFTHMQTSELAKMLFDKKNENKCVQTLKNSV